MPAFVHQPSVSPFSPRPGTFAQGRWWLGVGVAVLVLAAGGIAAEPPAGDFGKDIQLAPFVVKGSPLSVSIHARTKADRRYAEKFAEEVVEIAYETIGKSTGAGLVIIGREGEPHPVAVLRKFVAMAEAGQLDPAVAAKAPDLNAHLKEWKVMLNLDKDDDPGEKDFKITFDTIMPALPLPLAGPGAKLYQLAWAEGFDRARVEQKLRALTGADLEGDALAKYDWVFYLPPRNAFNPVMDEVLKQAMKHEKMGLMKRAAIRSAVFVFKPAVKTAVEGMRKGMLYYTVLQARSGYNRDDIKALTGAYVQVLMPDFKFNGGTAHERALEKIRAQQARNAEYARDPYVSPARLAAFDPAAYASFEGGYAPVKGKDGVEKPSRFFSRKDDAYTWQYRDRQPVPYHPAGERLLVSADGKATLEFKVDDKGAVTGVEERRYRYRHTYPGRSDARPPAVAPAH